jgi:hypothetical protein
VRFVIARLEPLFVLLVVGAAVLEVVDLALLPGFPWRGANLRRRANLFENRSVKGV